MKIDLEKLKNRLEEELKTLEEELESVGHHNQSNPDDWEPDARGVDSEAVEEGDMAEGIEKYESNTAILKQLEIRYNSVKLALKKMDEGTYGICEICNEKIEDKRLEANPSARTCIKHKDEKLN